MKNQLYTRTYEGGNGEEVIVVGNRKDVSDPVEGVMEAEFVFRDGKLIAVNARRFNEMSTYVCSYVVDPDESDGIQKDQEWFEMDIAAPRRGWNNGEALNDYLQHRVRDLSGRPTARLWQFRRIETERLTFEQMPESRQRHLNRKTTDRLREGTGVAAQRP